MSFPAVSELRFLLNGPSQIFRQKTLGLNSIGVSFLGSFSGSVSILGSNDDNSWEAIDIYQGSTMLTGGFIVAAGSYRGSVAGYANIKIQSSSDFSGSVSGRGNVSTAFFFDGVGGGSGGDIVASTLTIPSIQNKALATDAVGNVFGVPGNAGSVLEMAAEGELSLLSVVSNGTDIFTVASTGEVLWNNGGSTFFQISSLPSPRAMFYLNNGFIAVGDDGLIATSPNCIDWTIRTTNTSVALLSCEWTGSRYVVGGESNTILTSPDGGEWTAQTMGGTSTDILALCYTGILIAAGANMIRVSDATGVAWAERTPAYAAATRSMVYNGNAGIVVAVGDDGNSQLSDDGGETWQGPLDADGVTTDLYSVTHNGGGYVACGEDSVILYGTLTDPFWTQRAPGTAAGIQFNSVCYRYPDNWWVCGEDGAVTFSESSDASSWGQLPDVEVVVPVFADSSGSGPVLREDGNKHIGGDNNFTGNNTFGGTEIFSVNLVRTTDRVAHDTIIGIQVCRLRSDGEISPADNTSASGAAGLLLLSRGGVLAGATGVFVRSGDADSGSGSLTPGGTVYLGASGGFTQTLPTAPGTFVRVLGYAISSSFIAFEPGSTILENA